MPKNKNLIKVDLAEVAEMVVDGSEIVLKPEAEEALYQLLTLQKKIEAAIELAKEAIEKKALEFNLNFNSVQGNKVKAGYRYYGGRYGIDEAYFDQIPEDLYKKKISYTPITEAVDEYEKKHGYLPQGILVRDRAKQITFKLIDEYDDV